MSKSMKALVLAGVLSIAAASAAQAGGKVVGSDFRGHANVAPAVGTARSDQIPTLWRRSWPEAASWAATFTPVPRQPAIPRSARS
jgi:hypothetical protein